MEMDRINDNTIRVLINNDDLSAHGITVLDLLGDHKQIEKFFYSILDEVDQDHQFQGDNEALTFQVLPNKNGLELFISKADPDDPDQGERNNETVNQYLARQIQSNDFDEESGAFKSNGEPFSDSNDNQSDNDDHDNGDSSTYREIVIKYDSFEDFIDLAKRLRIESGASNLYSYKGHYYLELIFFRDLDGSSDEMIDNDIALAYEFGHKTNVTSAVLSEYGNRIMETSALELARYYFKD